MIFVQLFYIFFKIGLFSFGGGYGMLSLIQGEVVNRKEWLSMSEFTDIVAISQMTPGPIGINSATYIGYMSVFNSGGSELLAALGSLTASFAVMLPSFIIMLVISRYLVKYSKNKKVESLFLVLRPTVVGLIAAAALLLMNTENFGSMKDDTLQFIVSVVLFLLAFICMKRFRVSPILILLLSGIFGAVFYSLF